MLVNRAWSMPSKNTFEIKPIKDLVTQVVAEHGGRWIDPFANKSRIAHVTNDMNESMGCDYSMDALDFLRMFDDWSVDGVLFDPPYSQRQIKECYEAVGHTGFHTRSSFWGDMKREIGRIVKPGGRVITCSWNSGGVGMNHGFVIERVLLVAHGGWHNDTIITVESKDNPGLFPASSTEAE